MTRLPEEPRTSISRMLGDTLTDLSNGMNSLLGSLQATVRSGWDQLGDHRPQDTAR